jgi:hypothetical protein
VRAGELLLLADMGEAENKTAENSLKISLIRCPGLPPGSVSEEFISFFSSWGLQNSHPTNKVA